MFKRIEEVKNMCGYDGPEVENHGACGDYHSLKAQPTSNYNNNGFANYTTKNVFADYY